MALSKYQKNNLVKLNQLFTVCQNKPWLRYNSTAPINTG